MAKDFKKNNFSKERAKLEPRPKFYSSVDKSTKPASKKPNSDWKVRPTRDDRDDRPSRNWSDEKPKFGGSGGFERKSFGEKREGSGYDKPKFGGNREGGNDRPQRSFNNDRPNSGERSNFERKPFGEKREGSGYDKPKFGGNREGGNDRPQRSFNNERPNSGERSNFERKPFGEKREGSGYDKPKFGGNREGGNDRPQRSFNNERPNSGERSNFERKPFGEKREDSGYDKPKFGGNREGGNDRPKRNFDEKPSFGERSNFERKPFNERSNFENRLVSNEEERPKREFNDEKPAFGEGKFAQKPRRVREERVELDKGHFEPKAERPKRTFSERPREERSERPRREFSERPREERTEKLQPVIEVAKKVEEPEDMRLNKYVSLSGVASRRAAGEIIKNGDILVNDVVIKEPGHRLLPTDVVTYKDKKLVIASSLVYILMNKPKGFITTMSDELDRKTVMDLIDKEMSERIYPVGRLDRDTSGLLLFTNDGDMAKKMTHPSHKVKKLYHATLDKPISKRDIDDIAKGLELEDGKAVVDGISVIEGSAKMEVGIEIHIGKNRIVRRIFEHLGYSVEKLDRVYYGGLTKKDLPRGRYRHLTEREVIMLRHFS